MIGRHRFAGAVRRHPDGERAGLRRHRPTTGAGSTPAATFRRGLSDLVGNLEAVYDSEEWETTARGAWPRPRSGVAARSSRPSCASPRRHGVDQPRHRRHPSDPADPRDRRSHRGTGAGGLRRLVRPGRQRLYRRLFRTRWGHRRFPRMVAVADGAPEPLPDPEARPRPGLAARIGPCSARRPAVATLVLFAMAIRPLGLPAVGIPGGHRPGAHPGGRLEAEPGHCRWAGPSASTSCSSSRSTFRCRWARSGSAADPVRPPAARPVFGAVMESFDLLMHGFKRSRSGPQEPQLAFVGCLLGTLMGALPGLGPVNGVAILIPVTFTLGLPPVAALILWSASTTAPCTAAGSPRSCSTSPATSRRDDDDPRRIPHGPAGRARRRSRSPPSPSFVGATAARSD